MIVKIWPVKGVQGLKKAKLYIEDDNKVIKVELDENDKVQTRTVIDPQEDFCRDADSYFIENEEDISRVIRYMANEDKTQNKFISGYRCEPDTAITDFENTWTDVVRMTGAHKQIKNRERENMSFHMVQSFPAELDITDEEVHQCGLELLEKIRKHQGIVCSHVHPVVDEEGEIHGRCKHNHILLNAYMMPEEIDPNYPDRVKYHDCKDTYAQLQIWNDEIAIEHGLPIIHDPDLKRTYSWFENSEANKNRSWKERIRLDIEAARRSTSQWDEFTDLMQQEGYRIREGAHLTYTAPDGEHKVRANTLGRSYTKENLELYWAIRNHIEKEAEKAINENGMAPLWTLTQQHGPLTVDVPLGIQRNEEPTSYSLPLVKAERSREVLSTYFDEDELYDVRDAPGQVVRTATGGEIIEYLLALQRDEQQLWEQKQKQEESWKQQNQWQEEEEKRRQTSENEEKKQKRYSAHFRNSRTGKWYYIDLQDENGRYRSELELIFLLAIVILKSEDGLWGRPSSKERTEVSFGPTNWRIQEMIDSIHLAAEEGVETPQQLEARLSEVGAAYSRARSALQKTRRAQGKMEALDKALNSYDETHELVERIFALPEGPEKEKLMELYREDVASYKKAKAVMYSYKVTTLAEIDNFRERYADIQANLPKLEEEFEQAKEDYRRLKKLQYNMSLAQNAQYCYGPDYEAEKAHEEELPEQKPKQRT